MQNDIHLNPLRHVMEFNTTTYVNNYSVIVIKRNSFLSLENFTRSMIPLKPQLLFIVIFLL